MNIKIDLLEFLKKDGQEIEPFYMDLRDEMFKFVEGKLGSLKKAIRKEEKKKDCFVTIHIMAPQEQWSLPLDKQRDEMRITVEGYSTELTQLIYQAFSNNGDIVLKRSFVGADSLLN